MAEEFEGAAIFVGVSNNDTVADGLDYRDEFEVPYPLAHAPEVWSRFGVPYQPVTIVLGPTGEEVHRVDGPIVYEQLRSVLADLTA